MRKLVRIGIVLAAACSSLGAVCDNKDDGGTNPPTDDFNRVYIQIERLGNPLVSEVLFDKRDHPFHNATSPSTDETYFTVPLKSFVANVAGRNATVQNTLAAVLLPDELIVDPSKAGATAGWLGWALGPNYGGRKLTDDVVDSGLAALFGTLLDPSNTTPCLATDNIDRGDSDPLTTFPYLAAPH